MEGVAEIAKFYFGTANKKTVRRTRHLIDRKAIQVFRLGSIICARKSTLLAQIEEAERALAP
jgi:hypothetical protein